MDLSKALDCIPQFGLLANIISTVVPDTFL